MPELTGKLGTSVNGPEGLPPLDGDAWDCVDWRHQEEQVRRVQDLPHGRRRDSHSQAGQFPVDPACGPPPRRRPARPASSPMRSARSSAATPAAICPTSPALSRPAASAPATARARGGRATARPGRQNARPPTSHQARPSPQRMPQAQILPHPHGPCPRSQRPQPGSRLRRDDPECYSMLPASPKAGPPARPGGRRRRRTAQARWRQYQACDITRAVPPPATTRSRRAGHRAAQRTGAAPQLGGVFNEYHRAA